MIQVDRPTYIVFANSEWNMGQWLAVNSSKEAVREPTSPSGERLDTTCIKSTSTWPQEPRSSAKSVPKRDKELYTHAGYYTDPRDLPPGHAVGSMTVPCTLPLAPQCQEWILDTQAHGHHQKKGLLTPRSNRALYNPKNVEELIRVISTGVDVNTLDKATGIGPIHAIVMDRKHKDKSDLLLALLVYGSKVDVNLLANDWKKMTTLQMAIEEEEVMCIKALLAFGANVNVERQDGSTALDLAEKKSSSIPDIKEILVRLGAKTSSQLYQRKESSIKVPLLHSYAENMKPPSQVDACSAFTEKMRLYQELEDEVKRRITISASHEESPDDSYALRLQQHDLHKFKETLQDSGIGLCGEVKGGSRILSLDGGGIRGLVELEILMQLEEATGRKVTDLFDWIIGTSTGGIIALALVYGKKSLREIFQLYFMMKDRIFSKPRIGFGFNTDVLEEILKEYLDPDIKMTDVTHPKVLISAVKKATTNPELHFFNNCFGDEYMDYPVWQVARYTSATPLIFSECDNYVDGGLLCNNPTENALTEIQSFFRRQGKKLPIALVVSIGTGIYPDRELGSVDLFLGIQTLTHIKRRAQNLIALLEKALNQSERVAKNSQSRCEEQDIPFYRFSPKLNEMIAGAETDNEKLFNMVIKTREYTKRQGLKELVQLFHKIANASQHLDLTSPSAMNSNSIARQ